jgi:hypothetical protein
LVGTARHKVVTMTHATRLAVVTAALVLAASSAHAFTYGDQTTTSPYGSQGRSYGSTLADPDSQIRNFGGVDLTTPKTATTQPEGFSFRFGAGPLGSDANRRLAPPAWSMDPLYLERDH